MPAGEKTDFPDIFNMSPLVMETDIQPSCGIDQINGEQVVVLRFFSHNLDGNPGLAVDFFLQIIAAAPNLVAPLRYSCADDRDILIVNAHPADPEILLCDRIVPLTEQPTVFTPLIIE